MRYHHKGVVSHVMVVIDGNCSGRSGIIMVVVVVVVKL